MYFLFTDALVRSDLVEQIPNVAIICHEAPHLFGNVLRDYLLSIIMTYLNDSDNQVSDDSDFFSVFSFEY